MNAFSSSPLAGIIAVLLIGCASQQQPVRLGEQSDAAAASDSSAPKPDANVPAEKLSEGQMARLSELVNQAEIEQAKVAQSKASAPAVKAFADRMVAHHGDALRGTASLVNILKLEPADSATGARLKADAEATLAKLNAAAPADFDKAYVQSQIDGHQQVLDLIDQRLLPEAKSAEIKDSLTFARNAVERHLQQARALQAR